MRICLLFLSFLYSTYSLPAIPSDLLATEAILSLRELDERSIPLSEQEKESNRVDPKTPPISEGFPIPATLPNQNDGTSGATVISACDATDAPSRHMIYCSGRLLEAVMTSHIYPDSKTFVDRPMKRNTSGEEIAAEFDRKFPPSKAFTAAELKKFVDEHFDKEGQELLQCVPDDWSSSPQRLTAVSDVILRKFGLELNDIWKYLCREVDPIVESEPERFSLLYIPNKFIIPGGRFREFYYWDAYWVIRGLLASGMKSTVKNMIRNFAHIIDEHGFIPNGGRVYYLKRSQPPLFAAMVYEYYIRTKDAEFIRDMLPLIEKELDFWKSERAVTVEIKGEKITMMQYRTGINQPRPESYREDISSSSKLKPEEKGKFYQNLASAAESGWDFSSRWLADKSNLTTIETTNIVPVDLNSYICYAINILSFLHAELGNINKQNSWLSAYLQFREDFRKVFYVPNARGWYDYNIRTKTHRLDFYPSIAIPLFTQCYDTLNTKIPEDVYDQMQDMGALNFKGGVPTSMIQGTKQQWDFPNGWSPLNHMIIEGLRKSSSYSMQQKAFQLAERWILTNLVVFQRDKAMWEKYNVAAPQSGAGGEYKVQAGFGWSNGVILDLLCTYGDRLRYPTAHAPIIPVGPGIFSDSFIDPTDSSFTSSSLLYLIVSCLVLLLAF